MVFEVFILYLFVDFIVDEMVFDVGEGRIFVLRGLEYRDLDFNYM